MCPALSGRGQSDTGDGLSLLLLPSLPLKNLSSSARRGRGVLVPGHCVSLELEASLGSLEEMIPRAGVVLPIVCGAFLWGWKQRDAAAR